jgi:polyisoprenoid-binding protein YceI
MAQASGEVPVAKVILEKSTTKFGVKATVPIEGVFDNRDATLTFTPTNPESAVLEIKIEAAGVNTGSGMKDNQLKGKDSFNAGQDPLITFRSTKIAQTSPDTFDVYGLFTIRGVSKPERLPFTVNGKGTGSGEIKGTCIQAVAISPDRWLRLCDVYSSLRLGLFGCRLRSPDLELGLQLRYVVIEYLPFGEVLP